MNDEIRYTEIITEFMFICNEYSMKLRETKFKRIYSWYMNRKIKELISRIVAEKHFVCDVSVLRSICQLAYGYNYVFSYINSKSPEEDRRINVQYRNNSDIKKNVLKFTDTKLGLLYYIYTTPIDNGDDSINVHMREISEKDPLSAYHLECTYTKVISSETCNKSTEMANRMTDCCKTLVRCTLDYILSSIYCYILENEEIDLDIVNIEEGGVVEIF